MKFSQREVEFEIRMLERRQLQELLIRYGLSDDQPLITAIEAYACATARVAIATMDETRRDQ